MNYNSNKVLQLHGLLKSTLLWSNVFLLLLLFVSDVRSVTPPGVEVSQFSVPKARITLINLERGHVRTITEKVNNEVVLTVPTRYFEAYLFECNSTYPVEWNYLGEGAPTTTADIGRHFKDFYDVNSYTYQSILYMYSLDELQTGRYTCRGSNPEHEKLQIHYDLFVPGNGSRLLISSTEKEVFVPESKHLAALPCEVTDPSASLSLYKGNSWGSFQKLELNQSIIYRPRKGFILKMQELPDPFGTYMCTTENDNKRRRKVHLIPERLKSKYENSNPINKKFPVHFTYDYEYNRVLCCTGSSFVPKLQWAGCGSVLDCKIKSVCFEDDRCEPRIGHADETGKLDSDPGPLPQGCAGLKLRDDPNGDYGIFKCSTPGVSQYQPYLLNRGNIFLDFDKAPASEAILTLTKTTTDPIYVGNEVEYHCNSTRFYFGFGIRWAFQRGNGDIEFVEDSTVLKDRYFLTAHTRQTTFRIMHSDIKGIICFVPIANSATEWRTVSLPISVRDSPSPPPYKIPSPSPYKIPSHVPAYHGHDAHSQDYISNNIPYSSQPQPHYIEPYSTSRPKGYFSYNTDPEPTVSNVDISEIISFKEKPTRLNPGLSSLDILQDAQDRDYNPYSPSSGSGRHSGNTFKFPPSEESLPTRQRLTPEYSPPLPDYQNPNNDGYVNLQTHDYEPLFSPGSRIVNSGKLNRGQMEPTPYTHPLQISNESQDNIQPFIPRNKLYKPNKSKQSSYEKFPFGTLGQLRNSNSDYFSSTTTKRPGSSYFDSYVAKINANQKSLETFSIVQTTTTTPTPEPQKEYYDTDYNLGFGQRQPPSRNQKIFNKIPTGLPPTMHREQLAPTLPSHHNSNPNPKNDLYVSGSRLASKTILPPVENSEPLPYSDDYYRSALRIKSNRNGLQHQPTAISPFYYNFNGSDRQHQQQYQGQGQQQQSSSSWEKLPPSTGMKESLEYRDQQQQQQIPHYQQQQQQRPSSRADQIYDTSADDNNNYYYQRYAAESTEFPAASPLKSTHTRIRPTLHNLHTYVEEHNVRRSGGYDSEGENVPIVELG